MPRVSFELTKGLMRAAALRSMEEETARSSEIRDAWRSEEARAAVGRYVERVLGHR